jgi:hypothetical protein
MKISPNDRADIVGSLFFLACLAISTFLLLSF